MYKLKSIAVDGFWLNHRIDAVLEDDVNVIIGKNGSGKTTFMNIVHAVLAVDLEALLENSFHSVVIKLVQGKLTRTVKAERREPKNSPLALVEYHISNRVFSCPLLPMDEMRSPPLGLRRKAIEDAQKIRAELSKLVSLASLSVYRGGLDSETDFRDRASRKMSSVDARLLTLMQRLTQYQLELSNAARDISVALQRDVLTSLLYAEPKARDQGYDLDFDATQERLRLVSAYRQLGVGGSDLVKKIQDHIAAVSKTVASLQLVSQARANKTAIPANLDLDFAALEAFKLTRTVVAKSLDAEQKTKQIFTQIDLFLSTLKTFIPEKTFLFQAGELQVKADGTVPFTRLSSGEKQLLILFIEALLQRERPYVFLADEPELSLHISWQRNIIPAIRSLNPQAQIVVATHSPEVAGRYKDRVIDMEDILHG